MMNRDSYWCALLDGCAQLHIELKVDVRSNEVFGRAAMEALIQMPQTLVGLTFAGISVVKPPVVHDKLIEDFLRSIDEFRGDGKSKEEKQQLGDAGEDAVLKFERARLLYFGREDLAIKVSKAHKDDRSYDIDSFDLDEQKIFVEVKTTDKGETFPFILRRSQLVESEEHPERYLLYRLCEFPKSPKLYILSGSLLSGSELAPRDYWGWPKSKNA